MNMELVEDVKVRYRDNRFGNPDGSKARVRIWRNEKDAAVVLMTDLGDENPGASVTNTVEVLAQLVAQRYLLEPGKTVFVEHYPHEGGRREETFDLVEFNWGPHIANMKMEFGGRTIKFSKATRPQWRHLGKAEFEKLIGTVPL